MKTIEEWSKYVSNLSGGPLRSKAIAANSLEFVRSLQKDGISSEDIVTILALFANRLVGDQQALPEMDDQYLSYESLLPIVR